MTKLNFAKEVTALLVIDPYNDFISGGGKIWDRIMKSSKPLMESRQVMRMLLTWTSKATASLKNHECINWSGN